MTRKNAPTPLDVPMSLRNAKNCARSHPRQQRLQEKERNAENENGDVEAKVEGMFGSLRHETHAQGFTETRNWMNIAWGWKTLPMSFAGGRKIMLGPRQ